MMKRQTLHTWSKQVHAGDPLPTSDKQALNTLIDSHLEAMDIIDGGDGRRTWEQDRANWDKQIRLALADLRVAIEQLPDANKAIYILVKVDEMLASKLAWRKNWADMQAQIAEEFEEFEDEESFSE